MAESPKFDPMAGSIPIKKNAPSSGFDPMAGSVPFKKKEDTASSGVKASTDTNQEEDGFFDKLYSVFTGPLKNIADTVPLMAKGLARWSATGFSSGVGAPSMDIMAETKGEPVKRKTKEELLAGASETVNQLVPYEKQKLAKGTSSPSEIFAKGYITSGDVENISYQVSDGLVQMAVGAVPLVGSMLLFSKNFEQRFEETKAKGIPDDRAYAESAAGAYIETAIEKNIGVDRMISKGLGKQFSKEAIKDISEALLSREAFMETAKKYAKSFSWENIKQGFKKGFLPEAIEEFAQTFVDGTEQDLFDYYERKRKQGDPNAKLALYDPKEEEGLFNTVNAKTGEAELSPSLKSKTWLGALDAAFYGGVTGQIGGMFVDSRSFNPSIYSTLQNAYDSQGKDGLVSSVETIKKGLTKASEDGKLDVNSYNNALKNVDKIATNVGKFEQNSDINSYSRYVLYDHEERVIPETAQRIARVLAEATTPLELPTQDQINDNIKNGEVSVVPFEQENQVPIPYKPYVQVKEDENGNKSIEAAIPKSVVDAYNANQMAVQQAMNNPLFSVDSLTNNNKLVTIDDLKRIGQQGGIQGDLASQLNFNIIFEANKNNFAKALRVINYAKGIVNTVAGGQTVEAADLRKGYMNIASFSQGDTVFYNNKSAKIMEISPNGQKLKLSGIQEDVDANDEKLRLQDAETEQAIPTESDQANAPTPETPTPETPTPETPTLQIPAIERTPLAEEEQITGRTMRDAVGELIPFTYKGETGEIYTQSNGVVVFESPDRIYEFGNIKDIGDMSIDEFDITPQEMSIGNDYSVTIDGKTFTNKNQNPFKAITYDAEGNAVSIKLENEKGQTRVIKGTRAIVIDAKYKVKKLYDESTREQLAAATDEAARQAAAAEESGRQSTETPTPTENKPTEQAPSVAEREKINRVRGIAARLAAEETPEMTGNRQAVANLTSSLFTAGIPVEVMNSEAIRIKYGKDVSQGMFISKNGTIVINEGVLASEWGKTIIFHEGTHPIINIIRNTEPKLYKQLVDAIKEEAKNNPEVNKILQQVRASKQYKSEFTRNDELVVEAIARVASGKLKLNDVKPTLRQAIINFVNKIAKAMGFRQVLKDTNQVAFNKLANQIAEVLNAGRDISEIVGSKNVKKFANEDTQFRVNEVFEGILEQLGISAAKESKKGVTNYGVASALNKYYNEKFNKLPIDDFGSDALKIVSDYATDEVIFAMQKFGDKSGKGWYTEDFANAINKIAEVYPAVKEKEDVREIANIIIAIASNSTDVSTNLMRVIYGLETYQKTGKIPSNIGTGKALSAIATTIDRYNRLLETFDNNPIKLKEFLQTIRPISESKKAIVEHLGVSSYAKVLSSDYATNPEWDDAQVLPTSIIIFGPKIGAFYSNLSGLGGTPTIDRWCIRTMFRYRGDMRAKVLTVDFDKFIKANNLEGQSKGNILALAEEHAKEFDRLLGGKGTYASLTKEQRNAEMSKYRQGKNIYSKSADVVNDIKDGLTDDIKNKTKFAKDFRTFTKETFEKVQENILESTGEKLDISDIQAILWIFEKNLFGHLGVRQREDSTYSAAANRIISSINNGNVSLASVLDGTAKLADMKMDGIVEEGAMGDQYIIDDEDFKNGIDANKGNVNIEEQYSEINRETRLAPNGNPSNLTEGQYNQVRTPEFKAWFGDWESDPKNSSQVVDANGEPMVVYTGTSKDKDFDKFNVPANGAWFTEDAEVASSYATTNDSQKTIVGFENGRTTYTDVHTSPRVIPVFLNIRNMVDFQTTDLITDEQRESLKYAENYKPIQRRLFQHIFFSKSQNERLAGNYIDGIKYSEKVYVAILDSNQIKSAVGNNGKFSPTNPKIQFSDIDRTYTMESTVADAGMTMAEKEAWQEKNKVSQRQERNPFVQKAVEALSKGLITLDSYINTVRANMPIYSMPEVPRIPTFKEIVGALNKQALDRGGIVGLNKTFKDGERVASRLDIPAYNYFNTWVVSIHEGINNIKNGKILGYAQTAVLKNIVFVTDSSAAMNIAIDKGKVTVARIYGDWVNESPESAHKRATELMDDPEWVQVGMNPYRHSFFYDKSTGEALISAEEVIQVGALVLAKNPVRAPFGSQAFNDNFTFTNKLGEQVQFSDLSRDDKRIQTIRKEFSTYPKAEIVAALMGEPFNLSQEKAEDLVNRAFADPLAPSIPTGNPDTAIPEGSRINQRSKTVEEYNSGYEKYKKALLEKTSNLWEETKKYIALQYDSRFFARRKLSLASSEASLAQAQLRNLNGIAYSASQELAEIFENIFGNGLTEDGIQNLDAVIFHLRVLQLDRNTEAKYQDEVEKLTVQFITNIGRVPNDRESIGIASQARRTVPLMSHGKTKNGIPATSKTSEAFLDALRQELGENEFNMLKARADMFRKVGNNEVEKLRKAGIISQEIADSYKDDFYALRMTLDRLYGKEDPSILMLNGVPAIKGWMSLSKEGTESYISQDSRLMLAQSYIGTARAIAKNAFRESVFNENISTDQNGNQESIIGINGQRITFVKPANYIRDADNNIRSNGKELSVRDADEGYVNVPFKKDGIINYFQMEKETFNQIEGNNIVWKDNPSDKNRYYNITDYANRILTGFATRKNPFFFIGNVPMDLQQQIFFTDIWTQGSLVQSNVYSAGARAIVRTIKFTNFFGFNTEFRDKTLEEYIAAGGAMDKMSTMKEQRQRSIEISLVGKSKSTGGKLIKDKMKSFFFGMNERTEIAMRLAAYDQSKKNLIKRFEEDNNGTSPNEQQMLKIQEIAAAKSRAYTDFAQRGTSLPNLNVAYLNSSIQAAGAAAEYVYDNPAKAAEKVSQLVIGKFLGTLAIMALMGDAYDDLDEYRKDMYSFIFSKDTGKKDGNGKPIYATADIRNNPLLIPVLAVARTAAERTMRALQGKEQEDVTYLGTADRFFDLISQASPIPIPNVTSVKGLEESAKRLFSKHIFFNLGAKMLMGYDAFRNKDIISEKDKSLSPYMRGQDDPNIPYFYKTIAKSMSSFSSSNQISPAKMQAVAETFITSPKTNIFVALGYGVLSDVANVIVPASTEKERGDFSLWDKSKALKSITGKFASFTDSEKSQFRKNEQLYIQSKEESMKYNDQERVIDNQLKELQKNDSQNFFKNLDSFIEKEGYDESAALANRVKAKAASLYKKDIRANLINENMMNEVRILHYTQGAEGKAKLMKYMFESDRDKVEEALKSLIYYGSPAREVYEARDIYNKSIEK